jgi:quercetin dioxygenase-like cupin family protein
VRKFWSFLQEPPKTPFPGVKIHSAFLTRTMLTRMEFETGTVIPEHSHDHEQITIVLAGRMEITISGESRVLGVGDVAAVPSRALHSARVLEPTVAVDAWSPVRDDYR